MKSVKFLKSCSLPSHFPHEGAPEIAVIGRSNAGKSSLLNFIFQTKGLAKTSSSPGKTRLINFFDAETVLFADLPGWGYAKASKSIQAEWGPLIDDYLTKRKPLIACLFLLDIRREPSPEDIEMAKWLEKSGLEIIYVITKSDKCNQSELIHQVRMITDAFGKEPVVTSAKEKKGREHLLKMIKEVLVNERSR